jgi:hypothetical protein
MLSPILVRTVHTCNYDVDLDEPVDAGVICAPEEETLLIVWRQVRKNIISFASSSPDPGESLESYPCKYPQCACHLHERPCIVRKFSHLGYISISNTSESIQLES